MVENEGITKVEELLDRLEEAETGVEILTEEMDDDCRCRLFPPEWRDFETTVDNNAAGMGGGTMTESDLVCRFGIGGTGEVNSDREIVFLRLSSSNL
jgi:hypothetical protein